MYYLVLTIIKLYLWNIYQKEENRIERFSETIERRQA